MSAAREQNFLKGPCAASLFHLWAGLRVRGERKQRKGKILRGWFARWQSALLIAVFCSTFCSKKWKENRGMWHFRIQLLNELALKKPLKHLILVIMFQVQSKFR